MNQPNIYHVIIIGGGPAGYTAALYSTRANLSTLVLEKLSPGGQMGTTDQVDNYPGFPDGISGFDLSARMKQSADRFGAETKLLTVSAVHLDDEVKRVETSEGTFYAYTVILATGAQPRQLGLPEESALIGKGVSYCATCDGMFYRGKQVAVVGGGNTAVADALYLAKLCERVYLIHRRDQLRASRVYTKPLEGAENIELCFQSEVIKATATPTLQAITIQNNATGAQRDLAVQGLFIAVGRTPNTDLLSGQLPLTAAGYVKANEDTRTVLPGVFAAGDLREKPLRQIVTAASDGAVAAHCAEEYLQQAGLLSV